MREVVIGQWHERESREVSHSPSYYAADWETLKTRTGDYPARVTFETGYTIPMPYWLLVKIDADRTGGRLYSGFGGNNFASRELPHEPAHLPVQAYAYEIHKLVAAGRLTLRPEYAWLAAEGDEPAWHHPDAPKTWDAIVA